MAPRQTTAGFTLLEIIVAVAIVAVMAGALTPVIYKQMDAVRSEATTEELRQIKDSLLDFFEDTGRFPSEAEGLSALVADPGVANWRGPYLASGQRNPLEAVTEDAFGRPYVYDLAPRVNPANGADLVVASAGANRSQDMPDNGQTWILGNITQHDDIVCFVSASPLNREKEDNTLAELELLAAAARAHYLNLGSFPNALTDLLGDYIDGGYNNDTFVDAWNGNYLSQIQGGGTPVLRIWSSGPDRQNDNGVDDDLLLEINSAALDNLRNSEGEETEQEVDTIQNAIDSNPGMNLNGSWNSVRVRLGLSDAYRTDEWGEPYHVNVGERVVFSSGPDRDPNTTDDNVPAGVGP
jgi:general secretion pathway protein G